MPEYKTDNLPESLRWSVTFACIGGVFILILWAIATAMIPTLYFVYIGFLMGGFVGGGARLGYRQGGIKVALIGMIATIIFIILGDFIETAITTNTLFHPISDYLYIMQSKLLDSMLRVVSYLFAPIVGFYAGIVKLREL